MRASLLELFTGQDGTSQLLKFLQDFDDWPRPKALLNWLFELFLELPPAVWCCSSILHELLQADFVTGDGFPALELLGRAVSHAPALAEDTSLFRHATALSLAAIRFFSKSFLEKNPIEVAWLIARYANAAGGVAAWPLQEAPEGFLACLPQSFWAKAFLVAIGHRVDDGGLSFSRLPEALRFDEDVAVRFLSSQRGVLQHVGSELQGNREMVKSALITDGDSLRFAQPCFWDDEVLLKYALLVHQSAFFSTWAGQRQLQNRDLLRWAAWGDCTVLRLLDRSWHADHYLIWLAFIGIDAKRRTSSWDESTLRDLWRDCVAPQLQRDRCFVLTLLSAHGGLLAALDPSQAADVELVRAAVRNDGSALRHADPELWRTAAARDRDNNFTVCCKRRRTGAAVGVPPLMAPAAVALAKLLLTDNSECWQHLPAPLRAEQLRRFECCVCSRLPREEIRRCAVDRSHRLCLECATQVLRHDPRCPLCRADVAAADGAGSEAEYGVRDLQAEADLRSALALM